ncbi:carboxypeptidase regulatory-like domain-containing protein [Gimesia sp.]|uniref:carboxypeptidase regulatory-like domain-containing protein n=1 Tax=Gimesia sp. TaxID=2024833 RepID=UPI003A8FA1CD
MCVVYTLVGFFGCEGITEISGRITDSRNIPIKDAQIELWSGTKGDSFSSSDSELSDEKGNYSIYLTHAPTRDVLNLKVSKDGYKSHNDKIKAGTNDKSLNITLESEK